MKYTNEMIIQAVITSYSVAEVTRNLGYTGISGSLQTHISKRIKKLQLDTSHFKGQGWSKGEKPPNRLSASEVLVKNRLGPNTPTESTILRRCLIEIGRKFICTTCSQEPNWNGQFLQLQIDHINGNRTDNRPENLRFLCPNCHSQTETHSRRKI